MKSSYLIIIFSKDGKESLVKRSHHWRPVSRSPPPYIYVEPLEYATRVASTSLRNPANTVKFNANRNFRLTPEFESKALRAAKFERRKTTTIHFLALRSSRPIFSGLGL